jgi:cytochrome c-type biogenesis protein CcmH
MKHFSVSVSRLSSFVSCPPHSYFLLLAFCILFFSTSAYVLAVTTQEVEEALTCQCGCGLTVHSCNHLQCGFAVPAKKTIAELVAQGKGKEEITTYFVAGDGNFSGYGEKVLSAPTTSGFNLAAWITPFLAILIGGVLIGAVSLRWARHRQQNKEVQPQPTMATDQQRERLKKELESFEG